MPIGPGAGAIIGAGLQGGAGLASSAFGAGQSQSSARRARKFAREVMQNQKQWQVEDLRKAGINPMLASGASPTGHASGGQTISGAPMDIAGGMAKGASAVGQSISNKIDGEKAKLMTGKFKDALIPFAVASDLGLPPAVGLMFSAVNVGAQKLDMKALLKGDFTQLNELIEKVNKTKAKPEEPKYSGKGHLKTKHWINPDTGESGTFKPGEYNP